METKINELHSDVLINKHELDLFDLEEYTLDALNHETVTICGLEFPQGDVLKNVDPIAFRQVALDFQETLFQDEVIEETADGEYVWVQDVDLDELGLELNE